MMKKHMRRVTLHYYNSGHILYQLDENHEIHFSLPPSKFYYIGKSKCYYLLEKVRLYDNCEEKFDKADLSLPFENIAEESVLE